MRPSLRCEALRHDRHSIFHSVRNQVTRCFRKFVTFHSGSYFFPFFNKNTSQKVLILIHLIPTCSVSQHRKVAGVDVMAMVGV